MREILRAAVTKKPILAMLEPEASKGGLTIGEVEAQLVMASSPVDKDGTRYESHYHEWGLYDEVVSWGYNMPTAADLIGELFAAEPIEWNRIGFFQDVTMRLIATRMLPPNSGRTYVQGELISKKPAPLKPPSDGHAFHVYCSALNPGARELLDELADWTGFTLDLAGKQRARRRSLTRRKSQPSQADVVRSASRRQSVIGVGGQKKVWNKNTVYATVSASDIADCDHMLVYLTGLTWTRGEESEAFGAEVMRALDAHVHLLLVHESSVARPKPNPNPKPLRTRAEPPPHAYARARACARRMSQCRASAGRMRATAANLAPFSAPRGPRN